ncbi:MAG TPA: flagellar basal body P-ring protein FlgI [Bryobacteraceae bacterium]|nr:flagellar basal body P-ring protein FlgI [Bryobacteraceae bacterium]
MGKRATAIVFLASLAAPPAPGAGTRLKEVASLEGIRDNQLMGYGLVVGLAGTGDKPLTVFSLQTLSNVLKRMGVTVDPTLVQVRNVAAVMVTANLPPFAQPGTRIDITAAAIGDASNLQGGLLVMTPMKAADGQVYALAQGPVMTGGFVAGRGGNTQTVNHPTVGRVPEGGIVERSPPSVAPTNHLKLQLHEADFTTAARIVEVLNRRFSMGGLAVARAESAALVSIDIPASYSTRPVEFVAEMENLTVESDRRQRIVINERTGTIVMGKDVRITPVAIMHGALSVEVRTLLDVSQPGPFSQGQTAVTPETEVNAKDAKARNVVLQKGATVEELARALQAIGSTPRDIIAILQAMRAAGALEAEIDGI